MSDEVDCQPILCWPPELADGCITESNMDKDTRQQQLADQVKCVPRPQDGATQPPKKKPKVAREPLANVALAKWWRATGKALYGHSVCQSVSANPNTLLRSISKTVYAQRYMSDQVDRLQQLIRSGVSDGHLHAALATYLEKLLNLHDAEQHLIKATELEPSEKEYKWHLARIRKQISVKKVQQLNQDKIVKVPNELIQTHKMVERRSAEGFSVTEFLYQYAFTSTPVIITGLDDVITSPAWTLEHICHVAGACKVSPKQLVPGSANWAQLEDASFTTVSNFITGITQQGSPKEDQYLFDWSIPINCPELAKELTIPKYFADDFLQRTEPGSLYRDSWPSLFIAPAGLHTQLHIDAFESNFWMALFQGSKRWEFFKREDTPLLYPSYEYSMDPTFDVDLCQPDFNKHPLLSLAESCECILRPGEVLFVPAGCAHRVENLETSLAISANFVNLSNLTRVQQELEANGLVDERAAELLQQLKRPDFPLKMCSNLEHLQWKNFKEWPKDYSKHDT